MSSTRLALPATRKMESVSKTLGTFTCRRRPLRHSCLISISEALSFIRGHRISSPALEHAGRGVVCKHTSSASSICVPPSTDALTRALTLETPYVGGSCLARDRAADVVCLFFRFFFFRTVHCCSHVAVRTKVAALLEAEPSVPAPRDRGRERNTVQTLFATAAARIPAETINQN